MRTTPRGTEPSIGDLKISHRNRLVRVRLRNDESRGSSLMLALIFLTVSSLIVMALVSWVGNSLVDTVHFNAASSLEYATGGVAQIEIQNLRYTYQNATSGTVACTPGGGSSFALNGTPVSAWCSFVHNPFSASTRVATVYVCSSAISQSSCVAFPYLQATASFNDYTLTDTDNCTSTSNETSCGTAMSITGWIIT